MKSMYPNELKQAVEFIKLRIKENLDLVKNNQEKLQQILKSVKGVNYDRTEIKTYKEENNALLAENNELIQIEQQIINYVYKTFNNSINNPANDIIVMTKQEVWDKTITGEIEINDEHPLIDDDDFISKLIEYFIENEEYEKCAQIASFQKNNA